VDEQLAKVFPLEAHGYNTDRFGKDITRFVSPPYDVIDGPMERRLKQDRLNITHVTLGDEGDSYVIAARRLRRWLEDGVVVKEGGGSFYIYEQTFSSPTGMPMVRSGVIGLLRLEELSDGVVIPHEKTIPKHKADRLLLKHAVGGDTEQIFLLYDDPSKEIEALLAGSRKQEEMLRFVDHEGVHHRIVKMDPSMSERVTRLFDPVKILIADGHHRYETALEYRRRMRAKDGSEEGSMPYDFVLATFVSFRNPGLVVFPTHRLVQGVDEDLLRRLPKALEEEFEVRALPGADELSEAVEKSPVKAFGVWIPSSKTYLYVTPKDKGASEEPMDDLPVYMVQERVLKRLLGFTSEMLDTKVNIDYVKGTGPTKYVMASGEYQACFFVKPPSVHRVMTIAETGKLMPHKSTYFFPKIWSGTLLYLHGR
jgi:uncharacterized protein (DUF1015 family)